MTVAMVMGTACCCSPGDKFSGSSQRNSGVSDSDASIISKEDALKPPPIDNSGLCVQEPSGIKKLPSLTNEGKWCQVSIK